MQEVRELDFGGIILFTGGLILFLLGLSWYVRYSQPFPRSICVVGGRSVSLEPDANIEQGRNSSPVEFRLYAWNPYYGHRSLNHLCSIRYVTD